MVKRPVKAGHATDLGSIPGSGRYPGEGNGKPLHYSGLRIPGTEEPGGLQTWGRKESDTPEATAHLATKSCLTWLSVGFSRQGYWNELLFPSPGDLPDARHLFNPDIEPAAPATTPAWQAGSSPLSHQGALSVNSTRGGAKVSTNPASWMGCHELQSQHKESGIFDLSNIMSFSE